MRRLGWPVGERVGEDGLGSSTPEVHLDGSRLVALNGYEHAVDDAGVLATPSRNALESGVHGVTLALEAKPQWEGYRELPPNSKQLLTIQT